MKAKLVPLAIVLALLAALVGCSDERPTPRQKFSEALLASKSELADQINKAIRDDLEKTAYLATCEKYAKSEAQCIQHKVSAARAFAHLHGLVQQRSALDQILDTGVIPPDR